MRLLLLGVMMLGALGCQTTDVRTNDGRALPPVPSEIPAPPAGTSIDASRCGEYHREVRAFCLVAGLHTMMAMGVSMFVPAALSSDVGVELDEDSENDASEVEVATVDDRPGLTLYVGMLAIFFGLFSSAAVEVSSSLILELQYGWGVTQIGYATAMVYVACVSLLCTFVRLLIV